MAATTGPTDTELRTFIDRVIVPALLERLLREHVDTAPKRPAA
jgi:hypothetical protein